MLGFYIAGFVTASLVAISTNIIAYSTSHTVDVFRGFTRPQTEADGATVSLALERANERSD